MMTIELNTRYAQTIKTMTAGGVCEATDLPILEELVETIKASFEGEQLRFDCFESFFEWWDVTTAYDQMDAECSIEHHKPALAIAYEALVNEGFC